MTFSLSNRFNVCVDPDRHANEKRGMMKAEFKQRNTLPKTLIFITHTK